ncbi:unnamed protein product [Schistosoma intercalatum]|nr:unnamed protein product [Schistosoma intercalatum]CAH8599145.1 unnamed protein product [Schistosoma intercalatum]
MPSGGMQRSSLKIMRAEIFIIISVAFITVLQFVDAGAYGPCLTEITETVTTTATTTQTTVDTKTTDVTQETKEVIVIEVV